MKTNYQRMKNEIYQNMAKVFFCGISFFLADKLGWKPRRIAEALRYINGIIVDLNEDDVRFRDYEETLKAENGISIVSATRGIRIKFDEKEIKG